MNLMLSLRKLKRLFKRINIPKIFVYRKKFQTNFDEKLKQPGVSIVILNLNVLGFT